MLYASRYITVMPSATAFGRRQWLLHSSTQAVMQIPPSPSSRRDLSRLCAAYTRCPYPRVNCSSHTGRIGMHPLATFVYGLALFGEPRSSGASVTRRSSARSCSTHAFRPSIRSSVLRIVWYAKRSTSSPDSLFAKDHGSISRCTLRSCPAIAVKRVHAQVNLGSDVDRRLGGAQCQRTCDRGKGDSQISAWPWRDREQ